MTDPFFYQESSSEDNAVFKELEATELYCPHCRRAVPVKQRLLLVLPDGEEYEYRCSFCLTSVGTRIVRNNKPLTITRG